LIIVGDVVMNNKNLVVDVNGKWRLYQPSKLPGWEMLGIITQGLDNTGALARNLKTGLYAQVNAGVIRSLDGRKVAAALGIAGRPPVMDGGKRVNVYLDAESLFVAAKLGSGNVSEGIRIALRELQD
jgi:hypothetical protein